MSGVGEVLAIVSCVAGLIQAYDAGSRIVKQIKARRQAHGALPPSDLLEQSIDKGKREIQKLVEDGKQRFGPAFEVGDTTAQLALYKITIATQQALLDGLTQARDDDGIIDFDYCVDTSDKGRNDALLALHQLFQRKLDEEMERKRSPHARLSQPPESPLPSTSKISPPPYQHAPLQNAPPQRDQQPPSPVPKIKKSRTFFGEGMFRRKPNNDKDDSPIKRDTFESDRMAELSPRPSQQETNRSVNRRSTNSSIGSNATWSSASTDSAGQMRSIGRADTSASSITMVSRRDTKFSTVSGMSSMSGVSSISPITKYGACCKYAYELRDGNLKKGLMLQLAGFYGDHAFYRCASTKCQFQCPAAHDKSGYRLDTRVYNTPGGIKYRPLFLAKSHVQQVDSRFPSFRCLVCVLLKDESAVYQDRDALFTHLADHRGAFLGDALIDGQLLFNNHGASRGDDIDFDIRFPDATPAEPPRPDQGVAVVVSATLPLDAHHHGRHVPAKAPNVTAYPYEPDDNPWAN